MHNNKLLSAALLLLSVCVSLEASVPAASSFASEPEIANVQISPDGRHLLYVASRDGTRAVATVDLQGARAETIALALRPLEEAIGCRWMNAARFICSIREAWLASSSVHGRDARPGGFNRIVMLNADGSDGKVIARFGSWQDALDLQLVHWRSADRRSIFVESFARGRTPQVARIDVETGKRSVVARGNHLMPVRVDFIGSPDARVLIADALYKSTRVYWARAGEDAEWRELFRHKALDPPPRPIPFAIVPGARAAYARGLGEKHLALFQIDLEGSTPDRLIYESPDADILDRVYGGDGELLGVSLDTERPSVHYLDERDAKVVAAVDRLLADRFNEIVDATPDRRLYVIRSSSDVDAGSYYLLDASKPKAELELIGAVHPHLDASAFPRTRIVSVGPSAEQSRAFLTLPAHSSAKAVPLIVMPDDGPYGRAAWRYSFLRHFLVSRGYGVLQVQIDDTVQARRYWTPRYDLDGAAYARLKHAAQWAIDNGIAEPKRVAAMGWGFGGYVALLGAHRDPELFNSVITINAVTSLREQPGNISLERSIGNAPRWYSRKTLRRDARRSAVPIVLINGTHDTAVHIHQTRGLVRYLEWGEVPHEEIEIENGTHEFHDAAARTQLLEGLERVLNRYLSGGETEDLEDRVSSALDRG